MLTSPKAVVAYAQARWVVALGVLAVDGGGAGEPRSPQVLSCARDVSRTWDLLWLTHHTVAGRWPTVRIRPTPIQVGERPRRSPCVGAAPNGTGIGQPSPM